jgi:endoglucanase
MLRGLAASLRLVFLCGVPLLGLAPAACFSSTAQPSSDAGGGNHGDAGVSPPIGTGRGDSGASSSPGAAGYTVAGPFVLDAKGNKHIFRGVARPSLEWSAMGENLQQTDYDTMKAWGANIVRLSLNQDLWIIDPSNPTYIPAYPDTIDQQVQWAEADGLDVILDLHWSDGGSFALSPGQWCMADQNSLTFWTQIANKYKCDPHILFELYNEPYVTDWNVWLHGGSTSCNSYQNNNGQRMTFSSTFVAAGMQQLYDAVRATGAQNLVIVGGLQYAFDLSGVGAPGAAQGFRIKDASGNPAPNVIYNTHPYNQSGKTTPAQWYSAFGYLAATDPVIATEFGDGNTSTCNTANYVSNIIPYFDAMGASSLPSNPISWTAWAFFVGGCTFPSLLSDWTTYATTPSGAAVQASLATFKQP